MVVTRTQFSLISEKKKIFKLIQKNGQSKPFTLGLFENIQKEHNIPLQSFRSSVGKMISKIPKMKKQRTAYFIWYNLDDPEFFSKDYSEMNPFEPTFKSQ